MQYESTFVFEPKSAPDVKVTLRKITYGRRRQLLEQIGDSVKRLACHEAGATGDDVMAAQREREAIDRTLLEWGVVALEGLTIDGKTASVELLIDAGPEEVTKELLARIHGEIGLSAEERKN